MAVVGAGHLQGIQRILTEGSRPDIEALDVIPPVSPVWKWVGWGIPALIVGALVVIGVTKGAAVAGENLVYWIVANGVPSTLGAALALAHPLTVGSAGR